MKKASDILDDELRSMPKPRLSSEKKMELHQHIMDQLPLQNKKQKRMWHRRRWAVGLSMVSVAIILMILLSNLISINRTPPKHQASHVLAKVKGADVVASEAFKDVDHLDQRKHGVFYKPISFNAMLQVAPKSMLQVMHPFSDKKLSFIPNIQEAYLVTSKRDDGSVQHEVQFTYGKADSPGGIPSHFYIISITEVKKNPLNIFAKGAIGSKDAVGNLLLKQTLINHIPIYQQVITTPSALVYSFYSYSKKDNKIISVSTRANELYTYYKGYVIHVGYTGDAKDNKKLRIKMLNLTKQFILGE